MPVKSLNSSVIKWPDQKAVHNAVSDWAKKVSQDHLKVIRIGYIRSYARGDWGVGNDLDLIIILEWSEQPFWQRALELPLPDLPVPTDMLVYTMDEWQSMAEQETRFYKTVLREARWVYARD